MSLQNQWADNIQSEWEDAKRELQQIEKWENELLCHKARLDWMKDGDRNTKFDHAVIKERKRRQLIQFTLPDNTVTSDAKTIGAAAEHYFFDLFSASPYYLDEDLFTDIEPRISSSDNAMFSEVLDYEEIKAAINSMNPSSAPGQDGFTRYFYIHCWDIVKTDLKAMIEDFFKGGYLHNQISDTTSILIPKKDEARSMGDFRPISLCNFSAKLISKILATRLARLLPDLVDEEQAGFILERSISSHIVLAQDLIRDLNRKATGGNLCLKLDMAKAYDRLEWRFLLRTMKAMGFSETARDLIYIEILLASGILSPSMVKLWVALILSEESDREILYLLCFLF